MASPVYSAIGTLTNVNGTTSVPVPAGVTAGAVMQMLIVAAYGDATITPPAGWMPIQSIDSGSAFELEARLYQKIATGSEPSTYSVGIGGQGGGNNFGYGLIWVHTGNDTTTPIQVVATPARNTSNSTSAACPGVTTTSTDTKLVCVYVSGSSNVANTWTPPSGMTERFDGGSNPSGFVIGIADMDVASAGATGTKTATQGISASSFCFTYAIAPSGGGGSAPSITTNPSNQSVSAGATATFTAAASGSPTPTYQWQRNPGGAGSWADISGAVAASYTTPATTVSGGSANNGDTYRCVATNTNGTATTTAATLTVSASNAAPTFPGPSITDMTLGLGAAMSAVNVASKFNDTDALTFSAVGSWPPGLSVSSAGVISGTPSSAGAYTSLKVRATDTASQTVDSNTFTITISASAGTLNFQAAGMEFGRRTGLGIATFALDAASNYRYTVHANALTLGSAVYSSGVVATDSAGKLPNLTDASLVTGTTYRVHAIRQADGEAATFRMVAA